MFIKASTKNGEKLEEEEVDEEMKFIQSSTQSLKCLNQCQEKQHEEWELGK